MTRVCEHLFRDVNAYIMPKDFFQFEHMTELRSLPKGAQIYFIGICGVAMGQLAVALKKLGYKVSGSDKEFYEPMGSFLTDANLTLYRGYASENIPDDVDLVVIGNAISYGHPEIDVVEKRKIPYTCFPKLLHETIIDGRHSIVVSGTHGKSTTAAMLTHVLRELELDPSYFIGGVVESFPSSLHPGSGAFCVVEGDEYDDVFFSKRAKFLHYHPNSAIVNAIEFDHADLYDNVEVIAETFTKMVTNIAKGDRAICCIDFPEVAKRIDVWKEQSACEIITFGEAEEAHYKILHVTAQGLSQEVTFETPEGKQLCFTLPVPGVFNARNGLAASIVCLENGLDSGEVFKALATFQTVRRRQEVRYTDKSFTLIEDFAHHPTAVAECLRAIRAAYPERIIRAVFEPRSNTSRRVIFKDAYIDAFRSANEAILSEVQTRAIDQGQELLDVAKLAIAISESGTPCITLADAQAIAKHILETRKEGEVVVVMSNGSFGGLLRMLLDSLGS